MLIVRLACYSCQFSSQFFWALLLEASVEKYFSMMQKIDAFFFEVFVIISRALIINSRYILFL